MDIYCQGVTFGNLEGMGVWKWVKGTGEGFGAKSTFRPIVVDNHHSDIKRLARTAFLLKLEWWQSLAYVGYKTVQN